MNSLLLNLLSTLPGDWIPANVNGTPVRYYMEIPFNFMDQTENFETLELSGGFLVWD